MTVSCKDLRDYVRRLNAVLWLMNMLFLDDRADDHVFDVSYQNIVTEFMFKMIRYRFGGPVKILYDKEGYEHTYVYQCVEDEKAREVNIKIYPEEHLDMTINIF